MADLGYGLISDRTAVRGHKRALHRQTACSSELYVEGLRS